ncbi:hypothetical protein BDF20DRAFT_2784 [Mycotypha africana]|uniref:uncharacterized protein n=1 Tax=Mycotypha africana TaxID=64632 RepID=UPI0023005F56|nr:uncharacterized protein BDF20DRAFT_2784 [Mycotypha africana]KAI8990792.1 hypothetical protein BDF20DRAFT_2784 [Mycotypha africana]
MKAWNYIYGWANFALPSNIQKRLYKFVLRKAIGQFLQNELDLEHFDIALLNGSVELRDLDLNLLFINKLIWDTPFTLEKGRVSSISVSIPWSKLLSGDITIKIQGLHLTLRPVKNKPKEAKDNSKHNSEEHLMSSSLHFADDFLRTEIKNEQARELHKSIQESLHLGTDDSDIENEDEPTDMDTEGLQVLTRVIDKMMSRIKIDVIDTLIRISHKSTVQLVKPRNRNNNSLDKQEYFIDICIPRISYFDETPEFNDIQQQQYTSQLMESSILTSEIVKIVTIASPKIWIRSKLPSNSSYINPMAGKSSSSSVFTTDNDDEYQGTSSLFQTLNQDRTNINSSHSSGSVTPKASDEEPVTKQYEALLFTTIDEKNWIRMKLRPSIDAVSLMSIKQLDFITTHVRAIISPQQMAFFMDLFDTMLSSDDEMKPFTEGFSPTNIEKPISKKVKKDTLNNIDTLLQDLDSMQPTVSPSLSYTQQEVSSPSYAEIPLKSSQKIPASTSTSASIHADCKIKLQMTLLEVFILADDDCVKDWLQPGKNNNHLKFSIQQFNARIQQFNDESIKQQPGRRRSHQSNQYYSQQQQRALGTFPILISEIRLANISLDEWIISPPQAKIMLKDTSARITYDMYNPIFQLNSQIKHDYHGNAYFPEYEPSKNNQTIHKLPTHMSDNAIRIRIERKRTLHTNQFDEAQFFSEDVNVDIPPFKLLLDPRIVDRYDSYINVFVSHANKIKAQNPQVSTSQLATARKVPKKTYPNGQTCESSLFDALESEEIIQKRKVKVKLAFIRVILFVPDMSQASTREEFNDTFHPDQLSIDIKKVVCTFASTTSTIEDDGMLGLEHNYQQPNLNNNLSAHKKPNKINLELDSINVFMQLKDDHIARCWFTAKTIEDNEHVFSQGPISPTIEILIQDPAVNATMNTPMFKSPRTGIFGSGSDIPETLFNYLNRNESFDEEQKLYLPMDEQCESAMIFNQRTIETSIFVLNCHFPRTDMNLTKGIWDKVQVIQNDLLLWQPKFLLLQQKQQQIQQEHQQEQYNHQYQQFHEGEESVNNYSIAPSVEYHHFLSEIKSTASYFPDSHLDGTSSVCSNSYAQRQEQQTQNLSKTEPVQPIKNTLLSVVAVMGNGVWKIRTSAEHAYLFEFSEFRYFAAIKHLYENENITTLDIEDFELRDVSDPTNEEGILLLYKALPKWIHPKRNTSMISLISKLNNFFDSNTIKKMTSVVACNICWKATTNVDFINELIDFQKAPEDLAFIDPPTQYIKVFAHVLDVSIDYELIYSPTRTIVVFDGIEVITNILAGQPIIEVKTFLQSCELLLIDDKRDLSPTRVREQLDGKTSDARKYWCALGFIHTLAVQNIELRVRIKLDEHVKAPQMDVALLSMDVSIDTSADSFQTLLNLITFITNNGDEAISAAMLSAKAAADNAGSAKASMSTTKPVRQVQQQQKNTDNAHHKKSKDITEIHELNTASNRANMLASIDETAFKAIPSKISPPTFIDIPEMEEFSFVEEFYDSSQNNTPKPLTSRSNVPPLKPRRRMHQRQQTQKRKKASEDYIRMLVPEEELVAETLEGTNGVQQPRQHLASFFLIEDYFGVEKKVTPSTTDTIVDLTKAVLSLRVSNVNIVWKLYDGYDWDYVKSDIAANEKLRKQEEQKQKIPKLSTSVSSSEQQTAIGSRSNSRNDSDRDKNKTEASMEIKLSNVCAVYDVMPEDDNVTSYFHLLIKDVDIIDNIMTSDWKKFLGYMRSRTQQRETEDCMVDLELTSLKPVPGDPQQELRLKVKILPIRMYVDQDALIFLQTFFLFEKEFLRSTAAANQSIIEKDGDDGDDNEEEQNNQGSDSFVNDNSDFRATSFRTKPGAFFQHVDIYPITIKVDYKPKVFKLGSLKEGQIMELMNLFRLDGSELSLSHVKLTGIKGIDSLMNRLGKEWLPHILNTQKINMVSGVSPVRSLFNLSSGMADLVLLPIQQYRKDGRLLKGIQRGTSSFARATAIEAIKLGSRVASGAQVALEHADGFFSLSSDGSKEFSAAQLRQLAKDQPFVYTDANGVEITLSDEDIYSTSAPSSSADWYRASTSENHDYDKNKNRRSYSSDLSEGLQFAYHNISKNLESAAQTIFAVPSTTPAANASNMVADAEDIIKRDSAFDSHFDYINSVPHYDREEDRDTKHQKNKKSAKTVIRAVPVAVIKPMIGITSAFQSILTGLRSSIDPVMRLQSEDKYKKSR